MRHGLVRPGDKRLAAGKLCATGNVCLDYSIGLTIRRVYRKTAEWQSTASANQQNEGVLVEWAA
jgi:hypothetical protein